MKPILMIFPKKLLLGTNGPFSTHKGVSSQLWILCRNCFTILHNERGQGRYGNYIIGFSEKDLSQAIWLYWPKIDTSS